MLLPTGLRLRAALLILPCLCVTARAAGSEPAAKAATGHASRLDEIRWTGSYLANRLLHPTRRQWAGIGAVAVGAVWLESRKEYLRSEVLESGTEERRETLDRWKSLGEPFGAPAIGLSTWLLGMAFDRPAVEDTGFVLMQSFALSGLSAQLGQVILSEERPEDGGKLSFFGGKGHGVSGHAAIAASLSGPIHKLWLRPDADDGRARRAWKRAGSVLAYGLPLLTGLQRLEDDRHYAWNVLLGLSIGYTVGNIVAEAHLDPLKHRATPQEQERAAGSRSFGAARSWTLRPTAGAAGAPGLLLSRTF